MKEYICSVNVSFTCVFDMKAKTPISAEKTAVTFAKEKVKMYLKKEFSDFADLECDIDYVETDD